MVTCEATAAGGLFRSAADHLASDEQRPSSESHHVKPTRSFNPLTHTVAVWVLVQL